MTFHSNKAGRAGGGGGGWSEISGDKQNLTDAEREAERVPHSLGGGLGGSSATAKGVKRLHGACPAQRHPAGMRLMLPEPG